MENFLVLILFFGLLIGGFASIIYSSYVLVMAIRSKFWVKVPVVEINFEEEERRETERDFDGKTRFVKVYILTAGYVYEYNGTKYWNDKIYPFSREKKFYYRFFIDRFINSLYKGDTIYAYCNPKKPLEACLLNKGIFYGIIGIVGGIFSLILIPLVIIPFLF